MCMHIYIQIYIYIYTLAYLFLLSTIDLLCPRDTPSPWALLLRSRQQAVQHCLSCDVRQAVQAENAHGSMLLKAKDLYLGIPSHRQDQTRFCRATNPNTRDGPRCNHGRTYFPALHASSARLRVCAELCAHAVAIQTPSLMIFLVITIFLWRCAARRASSYRWLVCNKRTARTRPDSSFLCCKRPKSIM